MLDSEEEDNGAFRNFQQPIWGNFSKHMNHQPVHFNKVFIENTSCTNFLCRLSWSLGGLNRLQPPRYPLARTTIALKLRFTSCRLQLQEPAEMYLAMSHCRHNSNSTIDGYIGCSEGSDTFCRLQYLKVYRTTFFWD